MAVLEDLVDDMLRAEEAKQSSVGGRDEHGPLVVGARIQDVLAEPIGVGQYRWREEEVGGKDAWERRAPRRGTGSALSRFGHVAGDSAPGAPYRFLGRSEMLCIDA